MKKDQFKEITKWQKETFGQSTASSKIHHLKQEVNELSYELALKEDNPTKTLMEFADCFILLFGAADSYGMCYEDIVDSINAKMRINKSRKWGKPDENGVVNHVKNTVMSSQGNYPNTFKQNKKALKCYEKFGCLLIILVPLFVLAVFIIVIIKSR